LAAKKQTKTRKKREFKRRIRYRAHPQLVQQHDRDDDRQPGFDDRLASAGNLGFKVRKSRPHSQRRMAAEAVARKSMEHGMKSAEVYVKGPGAGREAAIRSLQSRWFRNHVDQRRDADPAYGCRPPKRRRV